MGYFGGVVFKFQWGCFYSLKISLKLSFDMPAFISVGFIFGSTCRVCITDAKTFFLLELLRASTCHWHPQTCPPPFSPAPPKKYFLHAEKLKYLICRSKNNIWKMHNWIHLKHKFHFGTAVSPVEKGKSLSGGEKAGQSTGTLRCQSEWAAVLSAAPLAFDLQK